jgi:hypothetical protein
MKVDVDVIAIHIMQVDLHNRKARHRINRMRDASLFERVDHPRHSAGLDREMFQLWLDRGAFFGDTDQMNDGVVPDIHPSAGKGKIRARALFEAKDVFVKADHPLKIGGSDIHMIEAEHLHVGDFLAGRIWLSIAPNSGTE